MRLREILRETAAPVPPLVDLRDPEVTETATPVGTVIDGETIEDYSFTEFVVLGKTRTLLFRGEQPGDTVSPKDLNALLAQELPSSWQTAYDEITQISGGFLLCASRGSITKWSGDRNLYSREVPEIARELLRRGVATPDDHLFSGNWANRDYHTDYGPIAKILARPAVPARLVLYHGTTADRWAEIQQHGLIPPRDPSAKQWKREAKTQHPDYRNAAVYLTASPAQAEFYAKKAFNVARRHRVRTEPIVLKITLTPADYPNLRADDDYLQNRRWDKLDANPLDWMASLSDFGQVAYVGDIPPDRIQPTGFKVGGFGYQNVARHDDA